MNNYNDYFDYYDNGLTDINMIPGYNDMIPNMTNMSIMSNMDTIPMNYNNAFAKTFMMPNNKSEIISDELGFLRGNMFNNLYDPYKNYQPVKLNPNGQKERDLNNLRELKFAMIDLEMYLDTNPNDMEALRLFNEYQRKEGKMCREFEMKYGPLTLDSESLNNNTWVWDNGPWPWEVQR